MTDPRHMLFLAENFFNPIQFPAHVVSGTNPQAGHEAFRVGTSRRSDQNFFEASDDTALNLDVVCDRVRAADTVVIDRNTNLAGIRVILRASNDGFVTFQDVFDDSLPLAVVQGASVDDQPHWIRTEEGAFVAHFPEVAGTQWRLRIVTTGTGTLARVGGVYLGKSFRPTYPRLPFDDATRWAEFGAVRRGVPNNDIRTGLSSTAHMLMASEQEWDQANFTFRELFGRNHPMWYIPQAARAERSWLSYNVGGNMAAAFSERPQGRTVSVSMEEYDPRLP